MRAMLVLCCCLVGCVYETNYYGADDGGAELRDAMGDVEFGGNYGGHRQDRSGSIFSPDDKLQGSANIILGNLPVTLIDVRTADGKPHMMTVSLGQMIAQPPPPTIALNDDMELVANVEIGVGGIPYLAQIDFMNGVQFSVAASILRVSAAYNRTVYVGIPANPGGAEPSYNAGASLANGAIAHGVPAQRTISYRNSAGSIAPAASRVTDIPKFSKSLYVVGNPVNAQILLTFLNNQGLNMAFVPVVGFPSARITVPNGATQVRVTNNSVATALTAFYLIYDLSL